jgi:hypothetical protein
MKLLLVEGHDITNVNREIEFGFLFDYVKIKFFVGVGDTVYYGFKGVTNEVNMNKYPLGSDELTTGKFDNSAGVIPLNQYEFLFTRALTKLKIVGVVGASNVVIEYYRM